MDGAGYGSYGYRLGPRLPLQVAKEMDQPSQVVGQGIASRTLTRRGDSTSSCDADPNLCEKPVAGATLPVAIGLGIGIPLIAIICTLWYLHRRNVKRQILEDMKDPHKSLDFGLTIDTSKGGKRKSAFFGGEKKPSNSAKHRQLSMDMNLSSPYLLPPELQQSRESLHSLARTLHQNEDPYRPVTQYAASEMGSIRSFPMKEGGEGSSVYTGSTGDRTTLGKTRSVASSRVMPPPRQNSLPKVPPTPTQPLPAHVSPEQPEIAAIPVPPPMSKDRMVMPEPIIPVIETVSYPDEKNMAITTDMPVVQEPPKIARKGLPSSPMPEPEYHEQPKQAQPDSVGLGLMDGIDFPDPHMALPPLDASAHHMSPAPLSAPIIDAPQDYSDDWDRVSAHAQDQYNEGDRGRPTHRRQSSEYPQEEQSTGLNVPQYENKRLSVGFRPLPPDEVMDTEDPETRANRIRSFYKEYFDESTNRPEMPALPTQGGEYYEDYDQSYLGDTAFFDPETNAFVMPYAQPVARRAMTPPPSRSRFPGPGSPGPRGPGPRGPGPRGPPRGPHGSLGGMSMPGGRGPFRPGSAASSNWGPGPRPGSSASNQWGRPRAGSAMSARGPRKPMPPPAALTTLPTPSKLKDDSFALMGAIDFAPPPTFADKVAGRPQSPLGERRPYQLNVPVSSPLVSAFDEMAALPSPHLLRKSGTFTALDFAPPRKFKDSDTMSDAGSIRSNRSGISTAQLSAIRSGAGRVSRLPGDTVFTQAALNTTLKPSWGMRD
ncbi:uncharacterized protein E0L32_010431 [Thyridium curvatum]|uniref:Uncharacterized protein n=1 Tax=Thyridium curvatum TaxID=1093900 RepID=A0A507AMQ0_9PEZI|nr:uncharacterized protein E0L32_010431 [Thyridium curvatum]TPX07856.1 hypothetical protein E0L32_010431 [Thyridium curvatum]